MTATNASVAIDTLIDDAMTMIARKNAETAIIGTGMNEMTPQNMTEEETIGDKATVISSGIRSEGFFTERSAERQRERTTQHWHQRTEKQKTTTG